MHNYAYSSCNLFTSYNITTYLIQMVVYGFIFCFFATDLGCFLVLWKLLLVRFCVVKCILFSAFQFFVLHHFMIAPSAIPRNYPDLREVFHSFPSSDFLVVFSYSFALEKRFSANVCKSGNYKVDKNKISDSQSESNKTLNLGCHRCICCRSILSLVSILFLLIWGL